MVSGKMPNKPFIYGLNEHKMYRVRKFRSTKITLNAEGIIGTCFAAGQSKPNRIKNKREKENEPNETNLSANTLCK